MYKEEPELPDYLKPSKERIDVASSSTRKKASVVKL
jgi:hypothetical protein